MGGLLDWPSSAHSNLFFSEKPAGTVGERLGTATAATQLSLAGGGGRGQAEMSRKPIQMRQNLPQRDLVDWCLLWMWALTRLCIATCSIGDPEGSGVVIGCVETSKCKFSVRCPWRKSREEQAELKLQQLYRQHGRRGESGLWLVLLQWRCLEVAFSPPPTRE